MTRPHLEIEESRDAAWLRLRLIGELDVASVPVLKARLDQLRTDQRLVRLDLSRLEFMDSSGVHLLVGALNDARRDGWRLEVEPDLSPQVERLFKLVHLGSVITGHTSNGG